VNERTLPRFWTTGLLNIELSAYSNVYVVAPAAANHWNIGSKDTPVALFNGATSTGACGAATIVVKSHTVDHALVPPVFVASTFHQYIVLFNNAVVGWKLVTLPRGTDTIPVEKSELVAYSNVYDVAPVEAFHVNVGRTETPVAPFNGDTSVGAAGGNTPTGLTAPFTHVTFVIKLLFGSTNIDSLGLNDQVIGVDTLPVYVNWRSNNTVPSGIFTPTDNGSTQFIASGFEFGFVTHWLTGIPDQKLVNEGDDNCVL
jgi:hypothetical protein